MAVNIGARDFTIHVISAYAKIKKKSFDPEKEKTIHRSLT